MRDWELQRRTPIPLGEIARRINPILQGWITYYSRFYQSTLYQVMAQVDLHLAKWIARKHK
ncbi:group II intron maturase-specific domain-containing protein [Escherichia coli]|uniref:group II intron maturase-specific domain-containing protein n=1 Tax=Escherichia coli TaxID=562 RepID=UPI003A5C88D0